MLSDLRQAARSLLQNPGFALTALTTLAVGIGANTAVFGLVNQLLLNPPGIAQPERVVAIRAAYDKLGMSSISISGPDFADVREKKDTFEAAAIVSGESLNYSAGGVTERLDGASVSQQWFDVFGARPSLGRVFTHEEDRENASPAVILADVTWRRLFGADPAVLGRTIELNKKPHRIVGVMPPAFRWPRGVEAWVPLQLPAAEFTPDYRFNEHLQGFARTRPGVSAEAADAVVRVVADRVKSGGGELAAFARDSGWRMFAAPARTFIAGDTRTPLLVLLGAVGFVLLIACSNIAGLMLARNAARGRDIAIRAALGASRGQLLRRTLLESLILAAGGAIAGLGLADLGMRTLLALAPERAVIGLTARIDLQVLAFTAAATIVAALLFGLVPAWQAGRSAAFGALKTSGRAASGPGGQRLRSVLVAAETALAVVLLVGAGLFLRSLARLQQVDPGFDPRGVMTATTVLPDAVYADPVRRADFFSQVVENLAATPGVTAAGVGFPIPFSDGNSSASFTIEGRAPGPGDPGPHGDMRAVTPGYFAALDIRLVSGRLFGDQDRGAGAVVIDENLARQVLAWREPDRQAGARRRGQVSLVADRGRRPSREALVARGRQHQGSLLPPLLAAAAAHGHDRGENERRPGAAGRADSRGGAPRGPRATGGSPAVDGRAGRFVAGRLAVPDPDRELLRGGRAGARSAGAVRRDQLHHGEANAGDRPPDGPRRAGGLGARDDRAPGAPIGGHRGRRRPGRRDRRGPPAGVGVVPGPGAGRADPGGHGRHPGGGGARRQLPARPPRFTHRPARGAQGGVIPN